MYPEVTHYDENANPINSTTHIIAVNSASSNRLEKYLIQRGINYKRLTKIGKIGKWIINLGAYTTPVCVVFFELSLPKGLAPAILSAAINAPMAAEFFDQFLGKVVINFDPRRVYPGFILFSVSGLVSGGLTSITGLQIATDALQNALPGFLYRYGQGVFFLNTYTTRCVAWPLAMHELLESVTWRLCGRFKPVYEFINDLEANFLNSNVQKIRATSYNDFVNQFYTVLEEKRKNPAHWSAYHVYTKVELMVQLASLPLVQHFFDLFQQLGAEGWSKISDHVAQMCVLNFFTALPNSIFYARSAWMFMPTLRCVLRDIYVRNRYYSQHGRLPLNTLYKVAMMNILMTIGIIGSQTAAWFSGAGMAKEVERYYDAASNNTLPLCVNNPNLSPANFEESFDVTLMTTIAGLCCNGTAALLFAGRHAIRRNAPAYSALSILYEIKANTMLSSKAFDKKFGDDFVNHIKQRRKCCILKIEQAPKDQDQKSWWDTLCCLWRKEQHSTPDDVETLINTDLGYISNITCN